MSRRFGTVDAVVVGLGSHGSFALWQLARRGARVVGLEQFKPGHELGSGHGHARSTRIPNPEGQPYVALHRDLGKAWRELENASGRRHFHRCGSLAIGAVNGPTVSSSISNYALHQLPHETLSASEAAVRFPQLRFEPEDVVLHDTVTGAVDAEAALVDALRLAVVSGARVERSRRVNEVRAVDGGVVVRAGDDEFRARRALLTGGPWMADLVPELPLVVERQVICWFRPKRVEDFTPDRFPFFHRDTGTAGWYAFPSLDGRLVKCCLSNRGQDVPGGASQVRREVESAEHDEISGLVARYLPGLEPVPVDSKVCLYTNTPDRHFVIGERRRLPGVIVMSVCSGRGFKFAPLMGRIAADLALDGRTPYALETFTPERFPVRPTFGDADQKIGSGQRLSG
jgi:sarcosine oxidase